MDEDKILEGTENETGETEEINEQVNELPETSDAETDQTVQTTTNIQNPDVNRGSSYDAANVPVGEPPRRSAKTTVVLIVIICILVTVIGVLGMLIFRNYLKDKLQKDVIDISDMTDDSVWDNNPEPEMPSYEPVEYNVTVQLGKYIGIEVDAVPEEVTEEDVQNEIDYSMNDFSEPVEITERPVQEGDVVNIDYTGYVNDVPFDGGADTDYDLEIGSGTFIPGFEEGLIGHNVGETVDVEVTFPEEYHSDELAGKDALFVVVINSITNYIYPELTDDFVKDNFEFDTVEAYRASIREELESYAAEEAMEEAKAAVFEKIVEGCTFGGDIDAEIADYVEQTKAYYDSMANTYYGIDGATLFEYMYGITTAEYEAMIFEETAYSVKYGHVLDKIAETEKFEVTDEEYEEEFESMFFDYYGFSSKEEVLQEISQEQIDEMILSTVRRDKAEAFILENAIINK